MHGRLRDLPANIGNRQHQPGDHDTKRMQPAQERHDDRGEAIVGGKSEIELARLRCRLKDPRQAGHGSRDRQGLPYRPRLAVAGVSGGLRRVADDADAKAKLRTAHHDPEHHSQDEGDVEPRWKWQTKQIGRQPLVGGERRRLRKVLSVGVLQRAGDEIAQQLLRDVNQHQAREDFIDAERVAQIGDDARPGRPRRHSGDDHDRHDPIAVRVDRHLRDGRAPERADDILPLGADVPDFCTIAQTEPESDQDQRRRLAGDVLPLIGFDDWRDEDVEHRARAIVADRPKYDGADDHRQHDRADRA